VGLLDGAATLSLQVKTSFQPLRTRGRGENKQPHHYEWAVGEKSAKLEHPDSFFAFVDLKSGRELPEVFIVPSREIFDAFNTPYFKTEKRRYWRWHPRIEKVKQYKNNWDILRNHLEKKAQTT
jgi:hypothetical protein